MSSIPYKNYYNVLSTKKEQPVVVKPAMKTFKCEYCNKSMLENKIYKIDKIEDDYDDTIYYRYCSKRCYEMKDYIECRCCGMVFHRDDGYHMAGVYLPEYCSRSCERIFDR